MSWPSVELAKASHVITKGTTPTSVGFAFAESGIPFVRVQNLVHGTVSINNDPLFVDKLTHDALNRSKIFPGDLLISIAGTIGRTALVPDDAQEMNCNQAVALIRPKSCLDKKYLRYWLESDDAVSQISKGKVTATISNLSLGQIGALKVLLPPLEEQKRIAAILDQADSLRRLRQRAIDRLNTLGQAIFYKMFGDLEEITRERLGDHTTKIGSGATPKGGSSAYISSGIPLVRSMNVRDGYFDPDGLAFIDEKQAKKLKNVILRENDVLLNITGASVARACRAPESVALGRVNQHVSIIRPRDTIQPEFLEAFLLFPKMKRKLLSIAGSGATRQAITKSQIEELKVPVPEITRQMEFVRRKNEAISIQSSANLQLDKMINNFYALQHQAFCGEL